MKTKALAAPLISILVLTASPVTLAQTNVSTQSATNVGLSDWQGLSDLKPGKKVLVEFKSGIGDPVERKFVSVSGSTLIVSDSGYQFRLEQRDIQRVYRLKGRWSRSTTARIGAGIGMVAGTVIGVKRMLRAEEDRTTPPSDADTGPAFAGFLIGSVAGAGIGALLGGKRKGKLLYEAK